MKIILLDLMDTVLEDPFHRIEAELLNRKGVSLQQFQSARTAGHLDAFEKGEIREAEYLANYYKKNLAFLNIDASLLPAPQRIKKELYKKIDYINGMESFLKQITLQKNEHLKLALASNYSTWYHHVFKCRPELSDKFDFLFFSVEMGTRKPEPLFYKIIDESLKKTYPDFKIEILFVDDRQINLLPAEQLGWQTVRIHPATGYDSIQSKIERFIES